MTEEMQGWGNIELQEKTIEPDKTLDISNINRNLQLGNLSKNDYSFVITKTNKFVELNNYPFSRGGPVFRNRGKLIMQQLNFEVVTSNSIEGTARKLLNTRINVSRLKDESPEKGIFSGLRRGREQ